MKKFCSALHTPWDFGQIVFTLYVTGVLAAHLFLVSSTRSGAFRSVFLAAFFAMLVAPLLLAKAKKFDISIVPHTHKSFYSALFYGAPFLVFLIYWAAYYPGGFTPDNFNQYEQVLLHRYNDWHPVLATLISFKLPLFLTNGWLGSVILFQILYFSAAIGYACHTVEKYISPTVAFVLWAFILLNPQTGNMAMSPWKDTLFAIATLLLTTGALHIHFTNGQWLADNRHTGYLISLLAVTTLLRHNAVLFTLPFLLGLFFFTTRKRATAIFLSVTALCLLTKTVLFPFLQVQPASHRQAEMLGLPMTVISAVAAKDPASMDPQTREFIYAVASPQTYPAAFDYGYNSIKFLPGTHNQIIEEYGAQKVLRILGRCFKQSPKIAAKEFIKTTSTVYSVSDEAPAPFSPITTENKYGISQKGVPGLRTWGYYYTRVCSVLFAPFWVYAGMMHLLLMLAVCAKCISRRYWKNILFVIPLFSYNFGTVLLLSGIADAGRFFFYTFLVAPVLLILLFSKNSQNGSSRRATSLH